MARFSTGLVWLLFGVSLGVALVGMATEPIAPGIIRIDALALFLAAGVTLISGIVHLFALRHMAGEARCDAFIARLGGLTLGVLLLLIADHLVLLWLAWTSIGLLLADLIGHVRAWPQARAAARFTRIRLLIGSGMLALALALLGHGTGSSSLHEALAALPTVEPARLYAIATGLALAAMIQCGLWPFQRWLLSSLTAPTPVSAFMHAGVVNAGGILLVRFAPLFEQLPAAMTALFLAGAASALLGSLAALVQTDVKRSLAASTSAQMGFMVLQCGLGYYAAALAHLVLHGFYKACQFLGSGSALAAARSPEPAATRNGPGAVSTAVLAAVMAGLAFGIVSGKITGETNSGTVLVVFAALAAAQAVLGLPAARLRPVPVLAGLTLAGALYGALVLGVERLLATVPGLVAPQDPGPVQIVVTLLFVAAWLALLAGLHHRSTRLYARILTASQPATATVTERREYYHA